MNKDNARLVAEVGAAARQLREQQALNQALADGARGDAEREALRTTLNTQVAELAHAREMLAPLTAERAYLAAQLDAQQSLLAEYRARVVSCRDFFEMSCRVVSKPEFGQRVDDAVERGRFGWDVPCAAGGDCVRFQLFVFV